MMKSVLLIITLVALVGVARADDSDATVINQDQYGNQTVVVLGYYDRAKELATWQTASYVFIAFIGMVAIVVARKLYVYCTKAKELTDATLNDVSNHLHTTAGPPLRKVDPVADAAAGASVLAVATELSAVTVGH